VSRPKDFRLTDGTVVDHLPVGTGPLAVQILQLPREGPVTMGLGVPSARYGRKDIVRVEGLALSKVELDRLALLGRRLTVSIVKDGHVASKVVLEVPERIEGMLHCPNPTCVTSHERVATVFWRLGRYPYRFRCHFCERVINGPSPADLMPGR
jgi:aspartate carbamoyltransferase regulatory subunit